MQIAIGADGLLRLLIHQLHNLFIFDDPRDISVLKSVMPEVLRRTEICFSKQDNKYYRGNAGTYFNPFHTAQYGIFLYFCANEIWRQNKIEVAEKLYCLNKALHGFDLFYEVQMPDVWSCDHPVGSVIGRASFGNGFEFSQNCTVGNNNGIYPTIGNNVRMLCGATLIGKSTVGDNVTLSAHCYVKDTDIPNNTIVFGQSPQLTFKKQA